MGTACECVRVCVILRCDAIAYVDVVISHAHTQSQAAGCFISSMHEYVCICADIVIIIYHTIAYILNNGTISGTRTRAPARLYCSDDVHVACCCMLHAQLLLPPLACNRSVGMNPGVLGARIACRPPPPPAELRRHAVALVHHTGAQLANHSNCGECTDRSD